MSHAALDIVAAQSSLETLPIAFAQRSSRRSALIHIVLLGPAAAAMAIPVALVAGHADIASVVIENPVGTFQLIFGLGLWSVLFVLPLSGVIRRFGSRRSVEITTEHVTVTDIGLAGTRTETRSLAAFDGIVHVVATSLSGVRQELQLVDVAGNRRIAFHAADRIGRDTIERAACLLRLPELQAKDVIGLGRLAATGAKSRKPPAALTLTQPDLSPA